MRIGSAVVLLFLLLTACGEAGDGAGSGSMGGVGGAASAAGAAGKSTTAGGSASAGSGAAAPSAGGGGDAATGAGGDTGGTAGSTSGAGGSGATGGGGAGQQQCAEVCEAMGGLSFPNALCEDAGAGEADAYFCSIEAGEGCQLHCALALANAPTESCRMQLSSLMACIAFAGDYAALLTSQPFFGQCEDSLSRTEAACWGEE